MLAHYGYKDGAGDFFVIINTDRCNGCADCVEVCPEAVLAMVEDEFDLDAENEVAAVAGEHQKKLKYSCAPCKPTSGYQLAHLPCVEICAPAAIEHSW